MRISILHPSARPEKWQATRDAWMNAAADPANVEYILCADERWGFTRGGTARQPGVEYPVSVLCWNEGRKCWVDAVNTAALEATGELLIVIADDIFPCDKWDGYLQIAIGAAEKDLGDAYAVEVSTRTPAEHERKLLCAPIVSRALYEQWGYLLFPGYESMYADNDIFEHAESSGVLIDCRQVEFEHRHPLVTGQKLDAVYEHQNRQQAYEFGLELLNLRRSTNFGEPMKPKLVSTRKRETIALMIPGETFSAAWVGAMLMVSSELEKRFIVHSMTGYSSNVFAMRNALAESVSQLQPTPDFILWLDDDQVLSVENLKQLLKDLDDYPEIDIVAGWTWRQIGMEWVTSCWALGSKTGEPMTHQEMMRGKESLVPIGQSGFPVVLMRYSALMKAGRMPFTPILSEEFQFGMSGEDAAFFVRARSGGAKCFVDRRVLVPHLKLGVLEPPKAVEQVEAVS
jgi:hypothetical protein